MLVNERRYDIDWLRVIAIGLLLIYHIAIVFQPWGVFIGFIQSDDSIESLWVVMSMLNVWRIPLLFFVSGMGVCFAMKKRNWKALLKERSKRILLPFLFGIVFIVPLHIFIWQNYYHQDLRYSLNPSHLWFLGNIFAYVLLLFPLFYFLRNNIGFRNLLENLWRTPLGLIFVIVPFVIEVLLLKPEPYEMYAMTAHGFFLGLLAFFFGYCFVLGGNTFWIMVKKWKYVFLTMALGLYILRLTWFQLKAPDYLMVIESNLWIFALLGLAFQFLNRPSSVLVYLSRGAYPIYILHMVFLYIGSILILPLQISVIVKFILIVLVTGIGCFISYDFFIRRVGFLRPLFGLK
jgi:hypothetical protein